MSATVVVAPEFDDYARTPASLLVSESSVCALKEHYCPLGMYFTK